MKSKVRTVIALVVFALSIAMLILKGPSWYHFIVIVATGFAALGESNFAECYFSKEVKETRRYGYSTHVKKHGYYGIKMFTLANVLFGVAYLFRVIKEFGATFSFPIWVCILLFAVYFFLGGYFSLTSFLPVDRVKRKNLTTKRKQTVFCYSEFMMLSMLLVHVYSFISGNYVPLVGSLLFIALEVTFASLLFSKKSFYSLNKKTYDKVFVTYTLGQILLIIA